MLVRLLYASRSAKPIDDALMKSILKQSSTHNQEHGVTGILCASKAGGVFLQALEGSREEVSALYANICRDDRHRDVTLVYYAEITERAFAGWRMGTVDFSRVNVTTILRYSDKAELDPFSMSGQGALALLEELAKTAAIATPSES